jgi:DNA-binding transcriptional ArsR family regulator
MRGCSAYDGRVEKMKAMKMMSALSQATRWKVYQHLVDKLPGGMSAGDIAKAVGLSPNGMTPHFAILTAAGLVSSQKVGRTVTYRAETEPVAELSAFLTTAVERGRADRPTNTV